MLQETVMAQVRQPNIKLWMPGLVSGAGTYYKDVVMKWVKVFGADNVLVVSQYDLERDSDSAWRTIAEFTALDANHLALNEWQSRRYNTNARKGSNILKLATENIS